MLTRPVAAILLIVTLPQLTGCVVHYTKRIPPDGIAAQAATSRSSSEPGGERIVGVTLADGKWLTLRSAPRPYIQVDTLHGVASNGQRVAIPMTDVQRVWVRRVDVPLSLLASFGVLVAVSAIVVAIAASGDQSSQPSTSSGESCPFVYSWDGDHYVFDAEPYGGATTRGLERDDWAALEHLRPVDGEYRLMLTNEVNETQYTNLVELLVVDHPAGVSVIPDARGGLHGVSALQPPVSARDRDGRDLLRWLAKTDGAIWEPEAVSDATGGLRQEVTLTFPRPAGATRARLMANVATGIWGSHMIRAMLDLWGRDVGEWYRALDTRQAARDSVLAWNLREEIFALKLYVQEPTGWQPRGVIEGGGPFIAEDRAVPLDLTRVVGDSVRIQVRPPVGFWALNSFAMDYGADTPLHVDTLAPASARDAGGSVRDALLRSDSSYHVMPNTGDHVWLTFRAPAARPGLERTVLLHSRGYYRLHLDATGPADTATLRMLAVEPGATVRYAAERYAVWRLARGGRH